MPRIYVRTGAGERFWSKIKVGSPDECWPWLAGKDPDGYGVFWLDGRSRVATRVGWEVAFGSSPTKLVLHKCDNPSCMNPNHWFEGDHLANQKDAVAKGRHNEARKTHCMRGHVFSEENTLHYRGYRYCRKCDKVRRAILRDRLSEQESEIHTKQD